MNFEEYIEEYYENYAKNAEGQIKGTVKKLCRNSYTRFFSSERLWQRKCKEFCRSYNR